MGYQWERIPVAVATVLMFMSPVWVAILGVVLFRERLTKQTVVTIVFCVLGAAMVANVAVIKSTEFISTATCSILSSLEVVVGAVVGILLFSEPMSFLQIAGGVIVVGCSLGQTLFNVKKKKKKGSEEVN